MKWINKIKQFLYHIYRGSCHELPTYGPHPGLGIVVILILALTAAAGWAGLLFSSVTFLPIFFWGSYWCSVEDPEIDKPIEVEFEQQVPDTNISFTE